MGSWFLLLAEYWGYEGGLIEAEKFRLHALLPPI